MVRKTKFWVILFSALFVLSLGAFLILWSVRGTGAVTARIWLDEEIVEEINLSTVAVPEESEVRSAEDIPDAVRADLEAVRKIIKSH